MNKQSGFTLIELVIVIIILGILAATAVPKFINLQGDARASAMQGVKAALEGGATLAYSRAAIDGVETSTASITMAGVAVAVTNGYPTTATGGIEAAVDLSTGDWAWTHVADTSSTVIISGALNTAGQCEVIYTPSATVGVRPAITVSSDGC